MHDTERMQDAKSYLPNQFLLRPRGGMPPRPSWTRTSIPGCGELWTDPQLPVSGGEPGDATSVTMVGHALDPRQPEATNAQIAAELSGYANDPACLLQRAGQLGGRHVIIVHGGRRRFVLTDAGGIRQVFFATTDDGVWCASQPLLLQQELGLADDSEAAAFAGSPEFLNMRGGSWWPGHGSTVAGVRHLLPNHLLSLDDGKNERFWPSAPLPRVDYEEAKEEVAADLRGLWLAAHARNPLTLLLTAGHDSRLLLAAARPVADDVRFVSISSRGGDRQGDDTEIPARLLGRLGLSHHVADASGGPTASFWDAYRRTAPFANKAYAANIEAASEAIENRWGVTGHVAEIPKAYYRSARFARRPTPGRISLETGTAGHPYAVAAQREWLDGAVATDGVNPLDLLYWEQRVGNWAGMWSLQYDLVWRDVLMPFNCRSLLTTLLALPEEWRRPPEVRLWSDLIRGWWPELLQEPFGGNPAARRPLTSRIRRSLAYARAR